MTAEVAVMNRSAIALAADSAVTLGGGDGKIYNTVNKLFTLSKRRPVGIMVFGNAHFMGIPYETLIKVYRESLGSRNENTIEDYGNGFIEFLRTSPHFSSETQQKSNALKLFATMFEDIAESINQGLRTELMTRGPYLNKKRQSEIIRNNIESRLSAVEKQELALDFTEQDCPRVLKTYRDELEAARSQIFGKNELTKANAAAVAKIAGLGIIKKTYSPLHSGIVIAGFGETEMFPVLVRTTTDGIVCGKLKWDEWKKSSVEHNDGHSMIIPFAQKEMVARFMEGVDPHYQTFLWAAMARALQAASLGIVNKYVKGGSQYKRKVRGDVSNAINTVFTKLIQESDGYRRKKFVDPILKVLVGLPKEELANLAEALVNLTSIKRRVSTDRETVGGPIDVAVISKGDGFVWIKRKHYFRPELNHHFLKNYLLECGEPNAHTET